MQQSNAIYASKIFPDFDSDTIGFQIPETLLRCSAQIGAYLYIQHDPVEATITIYVTHLTDGGSPLLNAHGFFMSPYIPVTMIANCDLADLIYDICDSWNVETDQIKVTYAFADKLSLALIKMADECTGGKSTIDSQLAERVLTRLRPCFAESLETKSEFNFICYVAFNRLISENDPSSPLH